MTLRRNDSAEQRIRGVELGVTWRVNEYRDHFFGYAYIKTDVTDAGSASLTEGERFAGFPLPKSGSVDQCGSELDGPAGLHRRLQSGLHEQV